MILKLVASMGPRLQRRGDGGGNDRRTAGGDASMGPRLQRRGDNVFDAKGKPLTGKLQWGHGFSAVETSPAGIAKFCHIRLQWGHGFSAVETSQPISRHSRRWRFNGA